MRTRLQIDPVDENVVQIMELQCTECGGIFPRSPEYFVRKKGSKALREICRKCNQKIRHKKKLDAIEKTAISTFCKKATRGGSNVPHTAELLEGMLNMFGGVNGFASMCLKQYFDCPPGSRGRSQMLDMVVKLTGKNVEHGGAKKPLDLYTEEEIEAEIQQRIDQTLAVEGYIHHEQEPEKLFDATELDELRPDLVVPERRDQEPSGGTLREEDGVPEALRTQSEAMGLPPGSGE